MDISEACKILGVKEGSDISEVKSAFKKLAIEYHPDKNKDPSAEDKFKEINSAYQFLEKNGTVKKPVFQYKRPFYNPSDDFAEELRIKMNSVFGGPVGNPAYFNYNSIVQDIIVPVKISFKEAVLGTIVNVTYSRNKKCPDCNDGFERIICPNCNGTLKSPNTTEDVPCYICKKTGFISKKTKCTKCNGSGIKPETETHQLKIPPGSVDGSKIEIPGLGNYNTNVPIYFSNSINYTNLILNISIIKEDGLILEGNNVISHIELTLLEALVGTKKKVYTIKGEKLLEFKPKIKNGDKVRVSGFGVPPSGSHIFVVNVTYPDDVSDIIKVLESKDKESSIEG